ncbi:Hsp20/alpha crystallin family protein [Aphelenchoides besseyi]|nr:Hsp20/alpha crystallin family protein [Aphelenchoides besseyi]KAI6199413.1 Hsp20/alpha crystallin family protein [Aphelenchoides besseyi]
MSLNPYYHSHSPFYALSPYSFFDPDFHHLQRQLGTVESTDGNFTYKCNVQGFKPDEIEVHQEGHSLVVSAVQKHNDHNEHYERSLKRVVRLPEGVEPQTVRTELNEKGELIIQADKKAIDGNQRKKIPITYKQSQKQEKK